MAFGDIKVQAGVAVFGATEDSLAISVTIADTSKALVRIRVTTYSSAGPDTAVVANLNNDDIGARIDQSSVSTGGFTVERQTGGINADVRLHWSVVEYVGPDGGPNEFEVIKRDDVRANAGVASGSRDASTLPITNSDWDKVTVHSTGSRNAGTGTAYADALVALSIDKTDGAEAVDYQRGTSSAVTWHSYCLVWWKGSNYSVQNDISHTFSAAGTNETETISAVTWAETVIFATHRTGLSGLDETGFNVWEGATTTSLRFRLRSGAGTTGQVVEAMLVSNPTWSVERDDSITGTETALASGNTDQTTTITSVDTDQADVVVTADCAGTGTAYPRQHWGYHLTAATTLAMRRGRNGQAGDWAWQVVEFQGDTTLGTGAATLAELAGAGSGTSTNIGTGSAQLEEISGAGSAASTNRGTGSAALDEIAGAGSGASTNSGTGAASLEELAGSGTGASTNSGPGSAQLEELSGSGTAASTNRGTGAAALLELAGTGTGTAESGSYTPPTLPTEPSFPTPVEGDCDIVIDCQTFEITFHGATVGSFTDILQSTSWAGLGNPGGLPLATLASTTGNPVGSSNGEINLLAQALNMCADQKTYDGIGYGAPLGQLTVGIKNGNAGSVRFSNGSANSWPYVRVSSNSDQAWDQANNVGAPTTPAPGAPIPVSTHGWDLRIVALTPGDAQMRNRDIGPPGGDVYEAGGGGDEGQTVGIEFYGTQMRVAGSISSGNAYINVLSAPLERLVLCEVDWLPLDPSHDGLSFKSYTVSGYGTVTYDAKWGVIWGDDTGLTEDGCLQYYRGNGTSRTVASSSSGVGNTVCFEEHNYYIRGGTGDIWYVDHGRGSLYTVQTSRTFSQIRPDTLPKTLPDVNNDVASDRNVVWTRNTILDYGAGIHTTLGVPPTSTQFPTGGGVMTVWTNLGDTWFVDNIVTGAHYQALVVVAMGADKIWAGSPGYEDLLYDHNRVFFQDNTLSNSATGDGLRVTAAFSDIAELHWMGDNLITSGTYWAAIINQDPGGVPPGASDGGTDIDIGVVYEYPEVDLPSNFSGAVKAWDRDPGQDLWLDVDLNDPVATIPEWITLTAEDAVGLAANLPVDFAFMWDLGWYGVPASDPVPGPDPTTGSAARGGYGMWWLPGKAYQTLDPVAYADAYYGAIDPSQCGAYHGQGARRVGSYFRPAMGPYSSSGQNAQSLAKADLDLALLRRPSDPRGRVTAWACEVAHLPATEYGGNTPGGTGWLDTSDIRVKNLQTKLARAELDADLGPCITIAYNTYFVAEAGYQTEQEELDAMQSDLEGYVGILQGSSKALRVASQSYTAAGELVLVLWIGGASDYTAAQWNTMLDAVRTATGEDFYLLARYDGLGADGIFDIADGCWPWAGTEDWEVSVGNTMRARASDWTRRRHDQIITQAAAAGFDKVTVGSLFPGFEDFARGFGQGKDRDIPRDSELVGGQIDRFVVDGLFAVQCGTWNDYPEGTVWEPRLVSSGSLTTVSVTDPPSNTDAVGDELRWLTEGLAELYGETVDPDQTDALVAIWTAYGQPRGCADLGPYRPRPSTAGGTRASMGPAAAQRTSGPAGQAQASGPGGATRNSGPAGARRLET